MDSSNHHPYKSRFFNFLNRQSLRWRDRLISSAQHLKIAVEWGVQILIYPLYLMVQAGRATRKQIGQAFKETVLPSQNTNTSSPRVDRPLKLVFKETEHCLSESKKGTKQDHKQPQLLEDLGTKSGKKSKKSLSNRKTSTLLIQGIASHLDNHDLVLVAENNTIIDILSQTQQNHLKRYIRLETANYWYDLKQKNLNKMGLIPTFAPKNQHIVPPIRWFWQLMNWMQTGSLAITLDFFGEAYLVPITPQNAIQKSPKKSLVSATKTIEKPLFSPLINNKVQKWGENLRKKSHESLNLYNDDPFRLQLLIYAAIDYFFNQTFPNHQLEQNASKKGLKSASYFNNSFISEKIDDPWLSWPDLYGEPSPVTTVPSNPSSPDFLPQAEHLPTKPRKLSKKRSKRPLKTAKSSKTLTKSQLNIHHKTERVSSNWVETEGRSTGYIKHPLVRILEWLDIVIHWIEVWARKFWKMFRKKR